MRPRVFPAEDLPGASSRRCCCPRFNEAAGIPRGRPAPPGSRRTTPPGFNEAAGIPRGRPYRCKAPRGCALRASMRPRVFPAEDAAGGGHHQGEPESASMRPRVFPAEDSCGEQGAQDTTGASMRPRVFPAEDRFARPAHWSGCRGFNEAAGIPRGRLPLRVDTSKVSVLASMRPRVFPAEDTSLCCACRGVYTGFNEAAGIPRGRLQLDPRLPRATIRASMRPRVFPAEDVSSLAMKLTARTLQ